MARATVTAASQRLNRRARGLSPTLELTRNRGPLRDLQARCWAAYRCVPEVRYVIDYVASLASKAALRVEQRDPPTNRWAPQPGPAQDLLGSFLDSAGGSDVLLAALAIPLKVSGEAYLIQTSPGTVEVFSDQEIRWDATESYTYRDPTGVDRRDPWPLANMVRVWRPDPQSRSRPFSELMSLLDLIDMLMLLDADIRATIRSRLQTSGILIIADEASFDAATPDGDAPAADAPVGDELTLTLSEAFSANLRAPGEASAVAPLIMRMALDLIEKGVRYIPWERPFDERSAQLRNEVLARIVRGLDAPPEIVTGLGSTTQWASAAVEESMQGAHVDPLVRLIADTINREVVGPAVLLAGDDPAYWRVGFSLAALNTAKVADVFQAHAAGVISDAALRLRIGFTDTDAPTDKEIAERMIRSKGPLSTDQTAKGIDTYFDPALDLPAEAPGGGGSPVPQPLGAPNRETRFLPQPRTSPPAPGDTDRHDARGLQEYSRRELMAAIGGATEMGVRRFIDRAEARLKNRARARKLNATETRLAQGREVLTACGISAEELLKGDPVIRMDQARAWAEPLGADPHEMWTVANDACREAALRHLHDPDPPSAPICVEALCAAVTKEPADV